MDKPINYVCKSCNYKFKRPVHSKVALTCPYCGSSKVSKYQPTLANDLLDSVKEL